MEDLDSRLLCFYHGPSLMGSIPSDVLTVDMISVSYLTVLLPYRLSALLTRKMEHATKKRILSAFVYLGSKSVNFAVAWHVIG